MPFKADRALQMLSRAIKGGRLGHAYLITGPTEAHHEAFATRVLNLVSSAKHQDLDEWVKQGAVVLRPQSKSRRITIGDDGNEKGTVRYLDRAIHLTSFAGGAHKFGIIVDADRMNHQAQNAFLRTLEEPPPRTLFLLLTSKPGELLPTIISRVIEIELIPEAGARVYSEHERKLLAILESLARRPSGSMAAALSLKTAFEEVLDGVRDEIEEEAGEDFAKEKEHYGKTTDSGSYLKEKEEQMKASIEANYLHQRDAMLELMLSWMGDILRHKVGAEHFDLPEYSAATKAIAERTTVEEATRRLRTLNKLERHLHTNVNENLALEVCFIQAFG